MRIALAAALTILPAILLGGAAAAQSTPTPSATASAATPGETVVSTARAQDANTPPAPEPGAKIVCVRSPPETGSHFGGQKVCHTESQWAMMQAESFRTLDNMRSHTNTMLQRESNGH